MRFSILVLLVAGACAPPPAPPVIDGVMMPSAVGLDANGAYVVAGFVAFHDTDLVKTIRLTVPVEGKRYEYPVDLYMGNIGVTITFSGATPKGTMVPYEIKLIDETGLESLPSKQMVTLN